jgi:SAM-dependent methyltransferase
MDDYQSGEFRWWHLSEPSPELRRAVEAGWLPTSGRVLDIGCGLGTELAYVRSLGAFTVGIDVSMEALRLARGKHGDSFVCADAAHLPFLSGTFDAVIDRGCFHYLDATSRVMYAGEARRVLRSRGRMLLRACLTSKGERNDMTEAAVMKTFAAWRMRLLEESDIPSDTRSMPALVAWLEVPPSERERDEP